MGKLKIIFFVLIFTLLLSVNCKAEQALTEEFFSDTYEQFDYENISDKIEFSNILQLIFDSLKTQLKNCIGLLCSTISVILLLSILNGFDFNSKKELKILTSSVVCTAIFSIAFTTIKSNTELVKDAIEASKVFSLATIPVVTTLSISSGESLSATVFSTGVSLSSSIFQIVSDKIIMPFILIYVLFGITGIYTNDFNVYSFCDLIKKAFKWLIGVFLSVFTFAVSMQSLLSKAADNLTKKTIQTAVGKFIPLVGSALSGSVESLFSLAAGTKTSAGIFGAVTIVSLLMPVILGNICYGSTMLLCKYIASFLKLDKLDKITGIIADIFFMLSAISGVCAFMLIVSFLLICFNIG